MPCPYGTAATPPPNRRVTHVPGLSCDQCARSFSDNPPSPGGRELEGGGSDHPHPDFTLTLPSPIKGEGIAYFALRWADTRVRPYDGFP